jgi:peptidoglycan LD-endopeptidase LytH
MMRAVLALLLIGVVGVLGFYFWQAATNDTSRARVGEPSIPQPPAVDTGSGAAPVTAPPAGGALPPPSDPVADAPPPVDTGAGAPPAVVPQADAGTEPNSRPAEPGDPGPLLQRGIGLPIAKLTSKDIHDTFNQSRGGGERRHEATDIMAPKGTPVLAVDNGVIAKLFTSKPGGLTVYQYDSNEKYAFYYAHLDRYAEGLREGVLVRRGQLIGYVGITGNSDPNAPHLHFAILQLGPEKKWYENTRPVDPYPVLTNALSPRTTSSRKSR